MIPISMNDRITLPYATELSVEANEDKNYTVSGTKV